MDETASTQSAVACFLPAGHYEIPCRQEGLRPEDIERAIPFAAALDQHLTSRIIHAYTAACQERRVVQIHHYSRLYERPHTQPLTVVCAQDSNHRHLCLLTAEEPSNWSIYNRTHFRDLLLNHTHDVFLVTEAEPLDAPGPRILYVNPAFEQMTGYTPAEVLGKSPRMLQGPETDQNTLKLLHHALRICKPVKVELINHRKDGSSFWAELDIQPIQDDDGWVTHFIAIQRDISGQKKADRSLTAQKKILEQIASGSPLPDVLTAIIQMIELQEPQILASMMLLNQDGQTLHVGAAPSLPPDYLRLIEDMPIGPRIGCCGTAAFSGKPAITEDIESDSRWPDPFRSSLLTAGIHSCWSWPITTQNGQLLGTLALYTRKKRRPSVKEADLVSAAAHLTGIAIEQHTAEEQIEAQRRRYIYLFDTNPQPLLLYDRNAQCFTNVNQAARQLYGYTSEEFAALSIDNLFVEDERSGFLTEFRTEGCTRSARIWRHQQKSGSLLEVELLWQSLPWEMRSSVLLSISDVTGRESARRDAEIWRERYEMALASFDRIFYVWYPLTDKVLIQGAFQKVFGFGTDEYPRSTEEWRALVHPEDRARILPEVENALLHQQPFTLRYRVRTRSGHYIYVEDQGHFIQDAAGKAVNVVGFIGDITEKIKLEMQMEQSQRLDAMGHLASGIAHDFANLLMVISCSAEMLLPPADSGPDAGEQRRLLLSIRQATTRASELTAQLMTFSRGHSSTDSITDINRALLDMRWLLQTMLPKQIQLHVEPYDHPLFVNCQRAPIDQIITNLTLNSRDAITGGGVITLHTSQVPVAQSQWLTAGHLLAGNYALLEVADNGSGIDPALLPRIFEPFFSTKPADKGTGLGLATVYGIVRQTGGAIHVISTPGNGATIRVYLPLAENTQPDLHISSADAFQTSVLLATSDENERLAITQILTDCNFQVLEAASSEQAITQATLYQQSLNVLITSSGLEGGSGTELAETLLLLCPKLRVLLIQNRMETTATTNYILTRPFTPAMLRQKLAQMLFQPGAGQHPA
jgi:PAS domain S-box-containing protein